MLAFLLLAGCSYNQQQETTESPQNTTLSPVCEKKALPALPDVTITAVTQESAPAPHCKVAGVIGKEIHFELLLPDKWNDKFVFGGGGGFAGGVLNWAQDNYPALQKKSIDRDRHFTSLLGTRLGSLKI